MPHVCYFGRTLLGRCCIASILVGACLAPAAADSSGADEDEPAVASESTEDLVQLTFPDNVELKTVIDYVAARLEINILYDDQVARERITIRSPRSLPVDQLLPLLRSVLKFRGLALVDAERAGWLTIVADDELGAAAVWAEEDAPDREGDAHRVQTRIVHLEHMPASKFAELIEPFLTRPGGNLVTLPDDETLIVTDYTRAMELVRQVQAHADVAQVARQWELVRLEHVAVTETATVFQNLLSALQPAAGGGDQGDAQAVSATPIPEHNAFLITGRPGQIEEAKAMLAVLDVASESRTRIYRLEHSGARRAAELLGQLTGPLRKSAAGASEWSVDADTEANALVVTASLEVHEHVERWLREAIDISSEASPTGLSTRVFSVRYARADALAATLQSVFGEQVNIQNLEADPGRDSANEPPAHHSAQAPDPDGDAATATDVETADADADADADTDAPTPSSEAEERHADEPSPPGRSPGRNSVFDEDEQEHLPPLRLTVDRPTNSIIGTGPVEQLGLVAELIDRLDRHRPQVLIDVTIVSVSRSNTLDLGAELQYLRRRGDDLDAVFSSFGFSEVDLLAGTAEPIAGTGLNAVLLRSDEMNVILRALQTRHQGNVVARPRLLVADNETGVLDSITEQPFTAINAGESVTTTSFGGYAEAGTQVTLTPQISEGDVVHLEYSIRSSSFIGSPPDPSTPPPRATDAVDSRVTLPSGFTLMVGGLTREDIQESTRLVPLLGDLPLVGPLFQVQNDTHNENVLYVFLRPVIHRQDRFAYLRYISEQALEQADRDPESPPLTMEMLP